MTRPLCVFHRNCADGLVSAWAVHRKFGEDVDYYAGSYSDAGLPDVDGRDVLIVDFSYKFVVLEAMARTARSVLVLDHHKTAQEDLARLPRVGVDPMAKVDVETWLNYGGTIDRGVGNLAALFDMERSGAGITWDYLHRTPRPRIVDLAEDRDLWRFRLGDETRRFHAALTSYDMGDLEAMLQRLDAWHEAAEFAYRHLHASDEDAWEAQPWYSALDEGRAILRYEAALVAGAVRGSRRAMTIGGHVVPVACVPGQLASDAGHLLCSGSIDTNVPGSPPPPFSATYYDGRDRRHFSLRSAPDGLDVGAVARSYGGGGHEHAAGFERPLGWEGEP